MYWDTWPGTDGTTDACYLHGTVLEDMSILNLEGVPVQVRGSIRCSKYSGDGIYWGRMIKDCWDRCVLAALPRLGATCVSSVGSVLKFFHKLVSKTSLVSNQECFQSTAQFKHSQCGGMIRFIGLLLLCHRWVQFCTFSNTSFQTFCIGYSRIAVSVVLEPDRLAAVIRFLCSMEFSSRMGIFDTFWTKIKDYRNTYEQLTWKQTYEKQH